MLPLVENMAAMTQPDEVTLMKPAMALALALALALAETLERLAQQSRASRQGQYTEPVLPPAVGRIADDGSSTALEDCARCP